MSILRGSPQAERFFVCPYPMREEQKMVIQKEMDRLEHLGIIQKGLTSYSSLVVLVK